MSGDTLTLQEVIDAVAQLRGADMPKHDGHYVFRVLCPTRAVDLELLYITTDKSYRVEKTAFDILAHERRRARLGRRGTEPGAHEVYHRAMRLEGRV